MRSLTVVTLTATMLLGIGSVGIGAPSIASAPEPQPPTGIGAAEVGMGDYSLDQFTLAAKELPSEMVRAVQRDLNLSAIQYLANAAAAVDAAGVLEELHADGVDVSGSRLSGTALTVFTSSPADIAAIEDLGATAVVGDPPVLDLSAVKFKTLADLRGGQAYYFEVGDEGYRCTLGFTGHSKSGGHNLAATAGHCYGIPTTGLATEIELDAPVVTGETGSLGEDIGYNTARKFGDGFDVGLITSFPTLWTSQDEVITWSGGVGAPLGSPPIAVTDATIGIVGAPVCKSGSTSGWTCGEILAVDETISTTEGDSINAVISDLCMLPGDSGGPAMVGSAALGINSAGTWENSCDPGDQSEDVPLSAFFPLRSTQGSSPSVASAFGSQWELGVTVSPPSVAVPAPESAVLANSEMSGGLADGNIRHTVKVHFDGSSSARTAAVDADGSWKVSLLGLAPGPHTYQARAQWGSWSLSAPVSGSFTVEAPEVTRISGQDRYEVAVNVSKAMFPAGDAPVVYLAKGTDYPDALSAAPAAVSEGAPLLLTLPSSLPAVVAAELERLSPDKIVVVGGESSVTPAVFARLQTLAPEVVRLGGLDRYVASRAVVDYAFDAASTAYIATGKTFPDALSASAAGGPIGAPVILVRGFESSLDAATRQLLVSLGVTQIKIAGGPASVSPGIESDLGTITPNVIRLGGADRFVASNTINDDAYSTSSVAFFATGYNFPDALAGAALAGSLGAPLYSVKTACVPPYVLSGIAALGVAEVRLLGGPATLKSSVMNLAPCS